MIRLSVKGRFPSQNVLKGIDQVFLFTRGIGMHPFVHVLMHGYLALHHIITFLVSQCASIDGCSSEQTHRPFLKQTTILEPHRIANLLPTDPYI